MNMVKNFHELTPELQAAAGGKGGMLARRGKETASHVRQDLGVNSCKEN
jgi:hypothetical protein